MVATMNPSGDFGKKELSPALRNRMTEIWVESYFLQQELTVLYKDIADQYPVIKELSSSIDLYLIIEQTAQDKLQKIIKDTNTITNIAKSVFNFIGFINFTLSTKHFSLQRKALSIRDILNMIDFIKVSLSLFNNDHVLAFRHAVQLVIIDGLCLGIDVAGDKQKKEIMDNCNHYLRVLELELFSYSQVDQINNYIDNKIHIGVEPFLLEKVVKNVQSQNSYAFDAETTKQNLLKLLRAYQLSKPILIEGPPGVGKTSLIENLAKVSGRKLIRVNLSEQTDMMDLLGSEYPVSSNSHTQVKKADDMDISTTPVQEEDEEEIRFHWCDGVLLQALKEGHWFLIDEMNLAQQSVLEGLNALLDHRRTVYIPELNQEFVCHPDFFVFACQNPSQSTSNVSGRKTLPKSFLNRFNKIYLEELTQQDYSVIINRQMHNKGSNQAILDVELLLNLSHKIESLIKIDNNLYQDEGAINMRDLSRFLHLYSRFNISEGVQHDQALYHAFQICYMQRLSKKRHDEAIKLFKESGLVDQSTDLILEESVLVRISESRDKNLDFLSSSKPSRLNSLNHKQEKILDINLDDYLSLKGSHSKQLQYLTDCLNTNIPLLIITNSPAHLLKNLHTLSAISGFQMNRLLLNEKSDTSQLLGCFEQTSQNDLNSFIKELKTLFSEKYNQQIMDLEYQIKDKKDKEIIVKIQTFMSHHEDIGHTLNEKFHHIVRQIKKGSSRFEWVDSILIKAIEKGEWVVFENANLCNPSILDRLNPLLEEGNQFLSINEQGLLDSNLIREVNAHKNFRSLFVISQSSFVDQGKDVSRALKNRCLQLKINYDFQQSQESAINKNDKALELLYSQMKWDTKLYEKYQANQNIQQRVDSMEDDIQLGKRLNRSSNSEIQDQIKYTLDQLNHHFDSTDISKDQKAFYQSYLSYLLSSFKDQQLITHALQSKYPVDTLVQFNIHNHQNHQDKPWMLFLGYKVKQFQDKIQKLLGQTKSMFLNKQSQLFISSILTLNHDETQIINYLMLLKQIYSCLKKKDLNIMSYISVYLYSKSTQISNTQIMNNEDHIMQIIMRHTFQTNDLDTEIQRVQSQGSNPLTLLDIRRIKLTQEQLYEVRQMPMKLCIMDLSSKSSQINRVHIKTLMENFNVIVMDDDKQILKFDSNNDKFDLYMIQEKLYSPYLIMIPNDQSKILISQSQDLYVNLNFLKDFTKLLRPNGIQQQYLKRHTNLPVLFSAFKTNIEQHFISQLTLNNLEHTFGLQNVKISLLQSVIDAENQVNLRDLPAYFMCNSGIQRSVDKVLLEQARHNAQKMRFRDLILQDSRLSPQIRERLENQELYSQDLLEQKIALNSENDDKANKALDDIVDAMIVLQNMNVNELLETLFIIPLEIFRIEKLKTLESHHLFSHFNFLLYHLKSEAEAQRKTQDIELSIKSYEQTINKLNKVKPDHEASQLLKNLLYFTKDLITQLADLQNALVLLKGAYNYTKLYEKVQILNNMLAKGYETFFVHFNHLLALFFSTILALINGIQTFIVQKTINHEVKALQNNLVKFQTTKPYELFYNVQIQQLRSFSKQNTQAQILYEQGLKQMLKFKRISQGGIEKELSTYVLEYFVRREIMKKMKQEQEMDDAEELIYQLPFKMKMQSIMENNKAMDERTKEDKEKMEKEALKEIETNFPSYFDEFQRTLFSSHIKDKVDFTRKQKTEIKVNSILNELLQLDSSATTYYKKTFIKLRVKMLLSFFENSNISTYQMNVADQDMEFLIEAQNYLREDLNTHQLPSVMNVTDVKLAETYNFYHDPLPHEVRLIYDPIMKLMIRIKTILVDWESPILNDALFVCNFIITDCKPKTTPVQKMLTGLELILNKLEEWEVYASKSINSTENEMNLFKQLIIRYRKIQILSWRNLLSWKKNKMIKEDFDNFIRLAHTLERQVFDKLHYRKKVVNTKYEAVNVLEIEFKMFELLDLFIRDSSLGQFQARMRFIEILLDHFVAKSKAVKYPLLKNQYKNLPEAMTLRLQQLINILHFVISYYSQFQGKLVSTIKRLDAEARDKVKTLIDVSKWTVLKFQQVKNNIDKTHRQLNRAVKQEEEILFQNISSLILNSSRKKYINDDQQLQGLNGEKQNILDKMEENSIKIGKQYILQTDNQIIKQLQFLEKKYVEVKWPDSQTIEYTILDIFERLKIVRDLNKKHIQRRAFIDLLKFMKDQGLQQNFQSKMSHMLIETKILVTPDHQYEQYYYKSHELMMLLDNSSQVDDKSDIRNIDIIRIRGFSQSLMLKMLQINQNMDKIQRQMKDMKKLNKESLDYIKIEENVEDDINYNQLNSNRYQKIVKRFKVAYKNLIDKVKMIDILDTKLQTLEILKIDFKKLNKSVLSQRSYVYLANLIVDILADIDKKSSVCSLKRLTIIFDEQTSIFEGLKSQLSLLKTTNSMQIVQDTTQSKRVLLLKKHVQLFFQDQLKLIEEIHLAQRKDSITDTTVSNEDTNEQMTDLKQEEDESIDLTIKERFEFVEKLQKLTETHLPQIQEVANKIFTFRGVKQGMGMNNNDMQLASQLIMKVVGMMEYARENEETYLKSLAKFSYISQRIFIYLIYEGFCGQDDQDQDQNQQDQEEDDKYFEQDGCGMGDGQGGENNVSNQIEHEEQLEGLKNYDSDEEKKEEKQEKKEEKKEEEGEDNAFEMKEADFDGELEDVPDKEEEEEDKKDEDDLNDDDALDKVDELLDNQLWNQQMEDMEKHQEEDEEEKKDEKEKEEIDLGERKLDQENQLKDQEKELKAGDHDKQDREEGKGEQDKQQEKNEEDDIEMKDEEQSQDGEEMPEDVDDEDKEEIPLDRDSNIDEDEKEKEKENEENKEDADMEDVKSQTDNEDDKASDADEKEKEDQDKIEEFEDQQKDEEIEQDGQNQDEEGQDDYQKDFNKQILENDQIQSLDQDKKKQLENEQSNLKRQQKQNQNENQQQNKNKENQNQAQDLDQQTQFDVDGGDILYQLAQKIQQKQQQKQQAQQQQQQQKPEPLDKEKASIENPQMSKDQQEKEQAPPMAKEDPQQDGQAMEYEFDDQAEQLQGKLATDKIEENAVKVGDQEDQENKMQVDEDNEDMLDQQDQEDEVQQTQQQIQNKNLKQVIEQESEIMDDNMLNKDQHILTKDEEVNEEDLIENYQKYLDHKANQAMDFDEDKQTEQDIISTFAYELERFDYAQQKQIMRDLFNSWLQDSEQHHESLELLNKFKQMTQNSSSSLCEQLRIVLEPQLSQHLQGDYKTGKRLNMKKVISFIASHYRNDKIWLRRTMPSKRDYKILIAIDDSLSMKENNLGFFSLESLVTIMEALNRLEVGKVAVAGIRERLDLFQSFEDGYSNERTAFIVSQFNFNYSAPKSADYAMANFVRDTNQLFDSQNSGGDAMNCPFVIVLSDGRFNKNNVRPYLNEAREKKYLYIFVILDQVNQANDGKAIEMSGGKKSAQGKGDGSILSMKSVDKNEETGAIKLVPYLKDFPFEYYCIVRDIHQLPSALGSILVQWFSLMSGSGGSK